MSHSINWVIIMKIAIYLVFIFLIFASLFIISTKNSPSKLLKILFVILGSFIICAMLSSAFINITPQETKSNIFFTIYVSCIIVIVISIANHLSHMLINYIIYIHEENNSENINRNPIKFLIEKKILLKKILTFIWFLGSLIMLSGIWFGK